jgi:hypothetical protein
VSRILVIALSIVILSQSFQRTWIVTSWKVNRNYIAANLCENRAVKESTCSGSCYLKKQLKEQDNKEQNIPASQKEKSELVCDVFAYSFSFHTLAQYTSGKSFPMVWNSGKPNRTGNSIFHPPTFLG